MKRFLVSFVLLFGLSFAYSQTYEIDFYAKVLKGYEKLKKGDEIHVIGMTHKLSFDNSNPVHSYVVLTDKGQVRVKEKLERVLDVDYKNAQNYWDAQIIFNVLEYLSDNGTQEQIRAEMENFTLDYIKWAKEKGLTFNDPYLESYIYSVIAKLSPTVLIDGRPGIVNLLILSDPIANASMYPNGTLVITTGLLSLLHSEDELAAVLAHEIAHFVLDHSIQNYTKMEKTRKRAEFWAEVAAGVAAVADGYLAAKNPYYRPGAITTATVLAASQIARSVCEQLGMKYSRMQESEADVKAKELMDVLKYDSNALATALTRIEESLKQERSIEMYFASDHPALIDRIKAAGIPQNSVDPNFEKKISFAVSDAAFWKMQNRRYRQALPLYSQNINNNVAIADDYIQKANCLLSMRSDEESYKEINSLINEAKKIEPNNINIIKTEIVSSLRQEKYREAKNLLNNYKDKLISILNNKEKPEDEWQRAYSYAAEEITWVNQMLLKLRSFN